MEDITTAYNEVIEKAANNEKKNYGSIEVDDYNVKVKIKYHDEEDEKEIIFSKRDMRNLIDKIMFG